jgi:hypothetical protein
MWSWGKLGHGRLIAARTNESVRRVFPSIAAFTRDWQPGKWLALPAILLFIWLLLVAVVAEFIDGWPGP